MSLSETPAVERIARVLAAQRLSINARGEEGSASSEVDRVWPSFRKDAEEVLRALREADARMAAAGDPAIWEAMVRAALAAG